MSGPARQAPHLYVSHAQVAIDAAVPVPRWALSEQGRLRTTGFARQPWLSRYRRIISSDETKAVETAAILGAALGIAPVIGEELHENDRSATGFLPPAEFEKAADLFFAHPDESMRGWERACDAQRRIVAAVETALLPEPGAPTIIVGHGGVGTLLWCHLAGLPISRAHDQPPNGGGNVYAFSLSPRIVLNRWRPFEEEPPP